ncbi:glutathione S-transferase [Linderina pennispora]|uniref:Glutathione S-transferase n=1 Tax=Linderina pennispora TaxID=61395 RepID=A0A1Y1WIK9_9FUNG|nr:glutathione S-transferase [Linderina pennispora]ORX73312.1 glutathione S-transferase [Linderina pennispora]
MSDSIAYPYKENGYTVYSTAACPYAQRALRALEFAKLIPTDAIERAQLRLFVEIFSSRVNPHILGSLRAATKDAQEEQIQKLLSGLREVSDELTKQWERPSGKSGPFWFGDKFSLAEVNTVSFVNLFAGPKHYRGLVIPETDEYAAYHKWVAAFSQHPLYTAFQTPDTSVVSTLKNYVAED